MNRVLFVLLILLIDCTTSFANKIDSLSFGAFGKITIYHPAGVPESFVLFISGDGGWNKGVKDIAGNIVNHGAMVAGIDLVHYLKIKKASKAKCYYPAGDFEEMSMTIQKKYHFAQYQKPILVGYSSGATFAYGMLAQAPANTFKGAISFGFCPDIEIDRPLCMGSGLNSHPLKGKHPAWYLEPCVELTAPFIAFNGQKDLVCNMAATKKFIDAIPGAELMEVPNVGHGFAVAKNWMSQYISAYEKIQNEPDFADKIASKNELLQSQAESLLKSDLPLTIIPTAVQENLPLAFFVSGDGGWTSFDQSISSKLAEKGMPVVGLDAQKFFWNEKHPKQVADDITIAIKYYMELWNRTSFVLIGYSFGACVAPFIANNFSDELKGSLKGVYCFSPDLTGDFEIHISDMLHLATKDKYNVPAELKQIPAMNPVCIFGEDEKEEVRNSFSVPGTKVETLPGNHHYNNDFNSVAGIVLKNLKNDK